MSKINRNYKDSTFRKLFNNRERIIELYNALSGSNYGEDTNVEIITLDNAIMGDRKNDLAFRIEGKFIVLIEHQSSINPNMPLRTLIYLAKVAAISYVCSLLLLLKTMLSFLFCMIIIPFYWL